MRSHFNSILFKLIAWTNFLSISCEITHRLRWMSHNTFDMFDNKSTLVQVMARCPLGAKASAAIIVTGTILISRYSRAVSRFVASLWETALLCNAVSHWLGASLESALYRGEYSSDAVKTLGFQLPKLFHVHRQNFIESRSSARYITVVASFQNCVQCMAVSLPCTVQKFRMIQQPWCKTQANEI